MAMLFQDSRLEARERERQRERECERERGREREKIPSEFKLTNILQSDIECANPNNISYMAVTFLKKKKGSNVSFLRYFYVHRTVQ
jgi:hypothetical protein